MSYKCLIIDDEPLARELIETYLEKFPDFELVGSCKNAVEASSIISMQPIDLIFLDIEMPLLKGTDFYKNLSYKPHVVFTTAYRDYALEGFDLNAVDYLLKPIFFERFFSAIQKFLKLNAAPTIPVDTNKNIEYIFVNKDRKKHKIKLGDVLYIESVKDYIHIHFKDETLTVKESISNFMQRIDNRFLRVHRSFIVNREKITAFTKNDIEIGTIEIPIGGSYKNSISLFP